MHVNIRMDEDLIGLSPDERIVEEAKKRYKRAEEWEAEARQNYLYDFRFANGDSQNLYQWPDAVMQNRTSDNRPCLTINKTKQHCLQIINDQRQNPSQIQIRPVGGGASYKAAKIWEGICRHIEYVSSAQQAYNNACYHQVIGGVGYWRVVTEYVSEDSFEQDIKIKRIADPMSVYMDCDIEEADGSDANWAFIYRDLPRDEFDLTYPEYKNESLNYSPLGIGGDQDPFESKEKVKVVEYFRRRMKPDKLHMLDNGMTVRESHVKDADLMDQLKVNSIGVREIEAPEIEWFLIGGSQILNRRQWVGAFIPIVRVIGEETVIDRVMDRKGHVRALIDPQRIYNYWTSSAVEFVALQSKTPYVTAIESIRGFELNWARANIDNKAYLPYNAYDEHGQKLDRPERAPPPVMSQAYLDGMRVASSEMMMVSGQYEANLGMKSNEVSGTAVDARQRQGENSTYHFIDRFSNAIRFTGRILVDLIPKIYDTKRIVRIMADDGTVSSVQVDPNAPQAHSATQDPDDRTYDADVIQAIFNPNVGRYEVEADLGPAFSTRRQETFSAISTILSENQQLTPIVGDLLFRAADFPMADELAERLHNMVPPAALGKGPSQEVTGLQAMLAQQHQAMQKMEQQLQVAELKRAAAEQKVLIEEYKAETERMKAVGTIDPEAFRPVIRQLVSEALGTPIHPIIRAEAQEASTLPQPPEPSQPEGQQ